MIKSIYHIQTEDEMYLKRHIDEYLRNWKKVSDRKPLIVKGAR